MEKARASALVVQQRVERAGYRLAAINVECLGTGAGVPGLKTPIDSHCPPEVVLRITVEDPRREAVERFTRELVPLVTSGPPGVTGYTGARPKPHRVLAYWPTTISRDRVAPNVTVQSAREWIR